MKITHRIQALVIALVLMASFSLCSTCYAAGVETFPYQTWYEVGSFSFSGFNNTPTKTCTGRYLTLYVSFYKPYWDTGTGAVELNISILDAATGQAITSIVSYGSSNGSTASDSHTFDLGYANRQVLIHFEANSVNPSGGNSRWLYISVFRVYVTN